MLMCNVNTHRAKHSGNVSLLTLLHGIHLPIFKKNKNKTMIVHDQYSYFSMVSEAKMCSEQYFLNHSAVYILSTYQKVFIEVKPLAAR